MVRVIYSDVFRKRGEFQEGRSPRGSLSLIEPKATRQNITFCGQGVQAVS